MTRLKLAFGGLIALALALPATAQTAAPGNVRLTCSVSGVYADGSRISGTGSEEIAIDVRPSSLAAPASNNIRVTANGRTYQGTLLRSATNHLAFSYVSDASIDGSPQTLALTYEVRLDQPRLRRTVLALFSNQFGNPLSAESNCVRPEAAAAAAAGAAPAPDWLVELRRKLKECRSKDPVSEVSCVERMQARFCANRSPKPPECAST